MAVRLIQLVVVALLTVGAWPALGQTATAPTIQLNPLIPRFLPNGDKATVRAQNLNPNGISRSDCDQDISLEFSLTLSGIDASNHVEAWVGSGDCSPLASRTASTAICKPAAPLGITSRQIVTVSVRARDLVANLTDNPKPIQYSEAGADACSAQKSSGAVSLAVYFIWVTGTGDPVGTGAKYDIKVDTLGPAAPTNVQAGDGDRVLTVGWTPATDQDTQGFRVYCDEVGAVQSADAGTSGATTATETVCDDAGIDPDSGEPIDGGCRTVNVTDAGSGGSCPAPSGNNVCKTIAGNIATSTVLTSRVNGTTYTVAVAATDGFGNSGPLSPPSCSTPGPVQDFFNAYRDAGGTAGGGFCALEMLGRRPRVAGASLLLLVAATFAMGLARRRRSSSR